METMKSIIEFATAIISLFAVVLPFALSKKI